MIFDKLANANWNCRNTSFLTLRIVDIQKNFFDGSAVQNKYESFHIFPFMSFPSTGMLRFANGLLSRWLDWIKCCILSSHTSGFDSQSSMKFFRFFFYRLGCLFKCENQFHLHIFIRRSNWVFLYFHYCLNFDTFCDTASLIPKNCVFFHVIVTLFCGQNLNGIEILIPII